MMIKADKIQGRTGLVLLLFFGHKRDLRRASREGEVKFFA